VDGQAASWIQTGGVLAFAAVVLFELRKLGPVLNAWVSTMGEVKEVLAALLERERIRDARRTRDSSGPHTRPQSRNEFSEEPDTGLHDIMERQRLARSRSKSPATGVGVYSHHGAKRPGTNNE
jgi:hypothetical protein